MSYSWKKVVIFSCIKVDSEFFGYQQIVHMYNLQTFYLTSPFSSGNRIIKTKPLFLLTLKMALHTTQQVSVCEEKKFSTKRRINFDHFESPSFVNFNSILVSQQSDRPHSASFCWHTKDFFRNIQWPLHHTKLCKQLRLCTWNNVRSTKDAFGLLISLFLFTTQIFSFHVNEDGLIFIWQTGEVSTLCTKHATIFYLGVRHYVTSYDIASRKSIIL